ncbi:MAG: endonuclease [Candidatus Syntrophosphaera sp.]|nr:endonuclease [Candidatus Syntrophosphaera sp.]
MRKTLFAAILLLFSALALAQGNYYDAVIDLTGNELYAGLHGLISTNTYNNYAGAKVYLFQQLENHNGYVTCIYTGYEHDVGYNYTGSSNPNTEHTYAQSWFGVLDDQVRRSDLHHLFPSTDVVNSSRGNLPLFTVANHATANVYYTWTPWQSFRGANANGINVFEPADETKGNIARALLYFNTRYYDTLTQANVNMIPDLVQWHYFDPPDSLEIARNQGVYAFQYNRNPYVDHPEFVGRIWGGSSASDETAPPVASLVLDRVFPNPFSSGTTLSLQSKEPQSATVSVYNARGQKIRSWSSFLPAGAAELRWDGADSGGSRLPAGIYLIRVNAGNSNLSAKVLMN